MEPSTLPPKLYKYKPIENDDALYKDDGETFNDWGLINLSKNQIWFPKPSGLNDPFDCQIKLKIDRELFNNLDLYADTIGKSQDVKHIIKSQLGKHKTDSQIIEKKMASLPTGNLRNIIKNHIQAIKFASANLGVLSLADKADNLLMWAYYAKYHQGYCLEFDTNEINPLTGVNLLNNSEYTQKMDYNDDYPSYLSLNVMDALKDDLAKKLLFHKSTEWKHEGEWRVLNHDGGKSLPYPAKLSAVILGNCVSEKARDAIKKAVEMAESSLGYKIDIKKAKIKNNAFKIDIK